MAVWRGVWGGHSAERSALELLRRHLLAEGMLSDWNLPCTFGAQRLSMRPPSFG